MVAFDVSPLHDDEVEEVVRLWRRSREDAQPWLEERMRHTPEDDLEFFRTTVMRENDIRVAHAAARPVAFLAMTGDRLNYLYVDPPHQKQGIGTDLLNEAKKKSPNGLTLFTHQRNDRARTFYERHGFRLVRFGVSPPPESEPDVEYTWTPEPPAVAARIRSAHEDEAALLSDLAFRSKSYWGYPDEFMEACRQELTYTAEDIRLLSFAVAEVGGEITGFYALRVLSPVEVELEALFVAPQFIGKGHGRVLVEHAKRSAGARGAKRLVVQGDPNAEKFYRAAGGELAGTRESDSIPGRLLPLFHIPLADTA